MRRLTIPALIAAVAASAACALDTTDSFNRPCERLVGDAIVRVDSLQAGGVEVTAGDSVQIIADVRRVESARAVLVSNVTVCEAEFSDPLDRPLQFSSSNAAIADVRQSGWVVGRAAGVVAIGITSDADVRPAQVAVQVAE